MGNYQFPPSPKSLDFQIQCSSKRKYARALDGASALEEGRGIGPYLWHWMFLLMKWAHMQHYYERTVTKIGNEGERYFWPAPPTGGYRNHAMLGAGGNSHSIFQVFWSRLICQGENGGDSRIWIAVINQILSFKESTTGWKARLIVQRWKLMSVVQDGGSGCWELPKIIVYREIYRNLLLKSLRKKDAYYGSRGHGVFGKY